MNFTNFTNFINFINFTNFITVFLCSISLFGQEESNTSQNNDLIEKYKQLSQKQLYDSARYYYQIDSYDTAAILNYLLINTIPKNSDFEQQIILHYAYNRMAIIYGTRSDYRSAYDFFIKALLIAEKYNLDDKKSLVYSNIGFIYFFLNYYEMAKQYYLKALDLCDDNFHIAGILNNMAGNELSRNNLDSAYFYIDKALKINKQHYEGKLNSPLLNNLGSYYQFKKEYDSAFYYFRLSLQVARNENDYRIEAGNLSDLGKLFFELNKNDSAKYYIDLSNKIATEKKYIYKLVENYRTLSEMEKSKGRYKNALNHYITYTNLKDSIHNSEIFFSVNLLQRQYEVSKTNQQIEELEIDRQLKENTIHYQNIIMKIFIIGLLLAGLVIFIIAIVYSRLRKAYKVLVVKNVEIIGLFEKLTDKDKKRTIPEKVQNKLQHKILKFMENTSAICDPEFTMEKLSDKIQVNNSYVSDVINNVLNKNFRSFLNEYRIREAQKLFSEPGSSLYTIEYVAKRVGFKSRTTFINSFKEVTGVNPSYYLKQTKTQTTA